MERRMGLGLVALAGKRPLQLSSTMVEARLGIPRKIMLVALVRRSPVSMELTLAYGTRGGAKVA